VNLTKLFFRALSRIASQRQKLGRPGPLNKTRIPGSLRLFSGPILPRLGRPFVITAVAPAPPNSSIPIVEYFIFLFNGNGEPEVKYRSSIYMAAPDRSLSQESIQRDVFGTAQMELRMMVCKAMDDHSVSSPSTVELAPASFELFHRYLHSANAPPDLLTAFDEIQCADLKDFFRECLLIPDPGRGRD
jgi:hypothetical protein